MLKKTCVTVRRDKIETEKVDLQLILPVILDMQFGDHEVGGKRKMPLCI